MADTKQRTAAAEFAAYWKDKGYEKGESQPFWLSLLRDVFGVEHPEQYISFEDKVKIDEHNGFIDGYIPATKVMIEQKSSGKNLNEKILQSDGTYLTPFQQAKRYIAELPLSQHPRFVITSNFDEFYVYDMEQPNGQPEIIRLEDLPKEYYRLSFLVEKDTSHLKKEMEVSIAAGEIVGRIYDALLKQYVDRTSERTLKSLNILCVRLVFCLYAEDSDIFGKRDMFLNYLRGFKTEDLRRALIDLFRILNTPEDKRSPYELPSLLEFPYVNGGLFDDIDVEIPMFTDEIRTLLLKNASEDFDWSEISPTIFGAVFESTLNPEKRREGGMHYTSIENIHKVIDPLFLDALKEELEEIKQKHGKTKTAGLKDFQKKLSEIKWLDPACGSGNFLTETYVSIRRLENEVISVLNKDQIAFADGEVLEPIAVLINQFYGIEINDFAVTVAKTALWIAESQMMKETEEIIHRDLNFLPLKTNANILEANALKTDWNDLVNKNDLNYIMGNPPFAGYTYQTPEQKNEIQKTLTDEKGKTLRGVGKVDYVACWYYKAAEYMQNTPIKAAFVSTNSITQGEQPALIFKPLFERFNFHIDFAYRTFKWDSEANMKAHVYCVIIGFSVTDNDKKKRLYNGERFTEVDNINAYLAPTDNFFIIKRTNPISNVPPMKTGNRPADGGFLLLSQEEKDNLVKAEPEAEKWIKAFKNGNELINNIPRYCLWLVDIQPNELKRLPLILERVKLCKQDREASPDEGRRKLANTPALFREQQNPDSYIAIPKTSSEMRKYIPIDFLDKNTIPGDSILTVPNASLYHFGVLTSNVHNAWMRAVGGRLKSDYRYSKDIVYNNFPWCTPTPEQKAKIEQMAQKILDVRAKYPNASLADLYDETAMPNDLRQVHQENDRAVMDAYGFPKSKFSESDCVSALMERYREIAEKDICK